MTILRRLSRNGNCTTVSLPQPLLNFVRWTAGDTVVVEVVSRSEIRLRLPQERDLRAQMPSTRVASPVEVEAP